MASIWDLIQQRIRQQQRSANAQQIVSGTVIGKNGTRVIVALGSHATECEAGVSSALQINDHVWVARTSGVPVIIGVSGIRGDTL